jgi:hypothetical protein
MRSGGRSAITGNNPEIRAALAGSALMHEPVAVTTSDGATHEVYIGEISDERGTADLLHGDINGWEWFVWDAATWDKYASKWPAGTFDGFLVITAATEVAP